MRIDQLRIQNFRGFRHEQFRFHPQFNVIAGNNGCGKTALLEALNVAMGSWLLGIRNTKTRHIRTEDIRVETTSFGEEEQYPVEIEASGIVLDEYISWLRSKDSTKGRTTQRKASQIKELGSRVETMVRNNEAIGLPLLAYYSTGRLWRERRASKNVELELKNGSSKQLATASRFRGYFNCLEATSNFDDFVRWFRGKEIAFIQKRQPSFQLEVVKKCVIDSLPGCKNIYFEFDPDKPRGLKILLDNEQVLPFGFLSDGMRNILALMADLAHRAVLLNPHLGEEVTLQTSGVVLIDELDLHLHPEWQKKIIAALRRNFPLIQFITTSHSPFVMQETNEGELIKLLSDGYEVTGGSDQSIEDIAEHIQDVPNPQWSTKREQMYKAAEEYYQLLEKLGDSSNEELQRIKLKLDELSKPFADNPAYVAFLEQKRLLKENGEET
ncbi:MAG: hypothetical protein D6730_08255 [Bacteroidetes bacterium]|nr:MAG: hypothetical protein D6730_08255 [Bacteroidota bacterium]